MVLLALCALLYATFHNPDSSVVSKRIYLDNFVELRAPAVPMQTC